MGSKVILKGTLQFGLVAIPVGLASAFRPGDATFKTLHRECGTPITQKRWCAFHDREVALDELVKGWEVAKGQFVVVEDDEIASVTPDTGGALALELLSFVDPAAVDPLLLDRAYYLVPAEHLVGRRAYALLAGVMAVTARVGIGRFTAWKAEHLCLIRRVGGDIMPGALAVQTLRLPADLVPTAEIDNPILAAAVETTEQERELARKLVDRLTVDSLRKIDLESRQRPRVQALLEAKLAGGTIRQPETHEQPAPTPPPLDLTAALKRSIRETPRPTRRKRATVKT